MCFGSSAMNHCVETGILRGRPYGGVMTLVSRKLERATEVICASERCVIVIVGNLLLINVYLPCAGVVDRHLICEEVLNNIQIWKDKYPDNICIIGGDFNTDLDVAGNLLLVGQYSLAIVNDPSSCCFIVITLSAMFMVNKVHYYCSN